MKCYFVYGIHVHMKCLIADSGISGVYSVVPEKIRLFRILGYCRSSIVSFIILFLSVR